VQTVLAKIFRSPHRSPARCRWNTVSRIAINTCINQIKHEWGQPELRMSDPARNRKPSSSTWPARRKTCPSSAHAAHELLQQLLQPLLPADRPSFICFISRNTVSRKWLQSLAGHPHVKVRPAPAANAAV
jgi:DNA-directed RNA polymerase specialized sigma24 family protein